MKLATINKAIRAAGIPLVLHRGHGYHYFLSAYAESESVLVFRLRNQPLERWLADAVNAYRDMLSQRRLDYGTSPAEELAMLAEQGECA